MQNLDTGRKFYNDLAKLLGRWKEGVKAWVYDRMVEARRAEEDLIRGRGSMRISGSGDNDSPATKGLPGSPGVMSRGEHMESALKTLKPAHTQPPATPPRRNIPSPNTTPVLTSISPYISTSNSSSRRAPAEPASPSTPLPAPTPTRVIPPPQVPSPMPGLWTGDGMTPLRFAGESPHESRKGGRR